MICTECQINLNFSHFTDDMVVYRSATDLIMLYKELCEELEKVVT